MGVVQRPDELQRVTEREVAEGRLRQAVVAGSADIEAGRYVTVGVPEDERRVHDGMMTRLRDRLSAGS